MASFHQWTACLWLAIWSLLAPTVVLATGDETVLLSEVARLNNQSLLWGPYRPNLYFGVRSRIPNGLMTGLMWSRVDDYNKIQDTMRYTCEQHTGIHGYGWDEFDTRRGGVQTIHDEGNGIDLTISFVKVPGGANGGNWAARIKGVPREGAPEDLKTTILLSVTQEAEGSSLKAVETDNEKGYDGDVTIEGHAAALGEYKLVVTKGEGEHPDSDHAFSEHRDLDLTTVQSLAMPDEILWRAKEILFRQLKENVDFIAQNYDAESPPPPWQCYQLANQAGAGNVQLVQKTFQGAFSFDVLFSSASAGPDLTSADLTREIATTTESFGARFSSVFDFQAPFTADKYKKFGRAMFSNLIGGIGYFYGHSMVDRSYAPEYDEENEGFWEETAEARGRRAEKLEGPYELFTSIPSRSFFPRGFLWDEGFHLLPIADWDSDLALEVVRSWFNLMDDDGWIAREQILGPEARSKVPPEFQVQYPHYANPPTLFFVVDDFITKLQIAANGSSAHAKKAQGLDASQGVRLATAHIDNTDAGLDYLRQLYPLLRRQYDWFRRTQAGDVKSYEREAFSTREAYRWRGRTVPHVLTSGLDDYPRPQPPHPGELHVDLLSWVGLMTRVLGRAAEVLGMPGEEAEELRNREEAIRRNLVDLHWDEKSGAFCDATIDDFEEHQLVCHKGYVSLFPMMLGLLKPDDPKLGKVLKMIGDEEELWSPHGLRSLSKKDELYGTEENYWRSPIWINMNYLAIVALHDLAIQDGPHKATARDLYTRLRRNIVETIYKSWEETGFAWEQYDPDTGKGQRTQHFTGWTSLVVKIMTMPDLSGGSERVKDEL